MTETSCIRISGDKLWLDHRQCPHDDNNACATCDHDGYYATKHGRMCPWFSQED